MMNHLFDLLEKILGAESESVELTIPEENFNLLMLRILKEKAKSEHKNLILKPIGPRGKHLLSNLGGEVPAPSAKFSLRGLGRFIKIPLLLSGLLLLIGGGAYAALYVLPQATVTLVLSPIPLVKEISVTASTEATIVEAKTGTIPATLRQVEETGQKSTPATGTAIVGEKAQISVKLKNCGTTTSISLPSGSKLVGTSSASIVFLLDSAVTIDGYDGVGSCPESEGSATAEKIGSSYNEVTSFSILGYSYPSHSAERLSLTKQGSSQEVKVAAAADQTKLLEDLEKELIEKAKETIRSQAGIDEVIVDTAIKSEVLEKTYSHAVGEQAENVTLTLKIKLTTITYKGADIQELVAQAMAELVPEGFVLFPGETIIDPLDPQLAEKTLSFQAKITAQVIFELDLEKIKLNLAGRNLESAQGYLASLGDISAYKLELWPNLPDLLRRVPINKDRIKIILETNGD